MENRQQKLAGEIDGTRLAESETGSEVSKAKGHYEVACTRMLGSSQARETPLAATPFSLRPFHELALASRSRSSGQHYKFGHFSLRVDVGCPLSHRAVEHEALRRSLIRSKLCGTAQTKTQDFLASDNYLFRPYIITWDRWRHRFGTWTQKTGSTKKQDQH